MNISIFGVYNEVIVVLINDERVEFVVDPDKKVYVVCSDDTKFELINTKGKWVISNLVIGESLVHIENEACINNIDSNGYYDSVEYADVLGFECDNIVWIKINRKYIYV